jgi:hypothetical protein
MHRITVEVSRAAWAEVLRLRQELVTAEAAERLESKVVAGRARLATVSVAGADADPQATAFASLIGVEQTHIRAGIAFLMALILEAGSALGFAIVATATKGFPQPQHQTIHRHANPAQPATQTQQGSAPSDSDIRRWALSGLLHAPSRCGSVASPGPPTLRLDSWQRHAVSQSRSGLLTERLALDGRPPWSEQSEKWHALLTTGRLQS